MGWQDEYDETIRAKERERCAKIADQFAKVNIIINDGPDAAGAAAASQAIAALIREQ